jgi:predicted SAM-dependent methyltransferase
MRKSEQWAKSYLNVGCGPNVHKEFVNIDYSWKPGIELCWDITKGLPFKGRSIQGIYTEHCLEHLRFPDCLNIIEEFRRILRPKGSVRIVVPDAELYLNLYHRAMAGEAVHFPYQDTEVAEQTPLMVVNEVFRSHGHHYAYDSNTLGLMLGRAGFSDIHKETFGHGRDPYLLIDSEHRAIESLYMEATA